MSHGGFVGWHDHKYKGLALRNSHVLLVPGAGIEPARGCPPGGLSPLRLPVPPSGQERI